MTKIQERSNLIDKLLQARQDGLVSFSRSTKMLLEMGVKIGSQSTGEINIPDNFLPFIEKYNRSNLEFEWVAKYNDGSELYQFGLDSEHNFGDIDQSRLSSIALISNFNWPTDNEDKRVIVRLNLDTGLFDILNGFAPQEVKTALQITAVPGPKKLILLTKNRSSAAMGELPPDLAVFYPIPTDEMFFYHQFVLGFEMPTGIKRCCLIRPNGEIELFE